MKFRSIKNKWNERNSILSYFWSRRILRCLTICSYAFLHMETSEIHIIGRFEMQLSLARGEKYRQRLYKRRCDLFDDIVGYCNGVVTAIDVALTIVLNGSLFGHAYDATGYPPYNSAINSRRRSSTVCTLGIADNAASWLTYRGIQSRWSAEPADELSILLSIVQPHIGRFDSVLCCCHPSQMPTPHRPPPTSSFSTYTTETAFAITLPPRVFS